MIRNYLKLSHNKIKLCLSQNNSIILLNKNLTKQKFQIFKDSNCTMHHIGLNVERMYHCKYFRRTDKHNISQHVRHGNLCGCGVTDVDWFICSNDVIDLVISQILKNNYFNLQVLIILISQAQIIHCQDVTRSLVPKNVAAYTNEPYGSSSTAVSVRLNNV